MAGWIKMPLGTEVGLGQSDILCQMGIQLPQKKAQPQISGPYLLWPNGFMDQVCSWYGGRPRPRRYFVKWGSTPWIGARTAPTFRPMSPISATADCWALVKITTTRQPTLIHNCTVCRVWKEVQYRNTLKIIQSHAKLDSMRWFSHRCSPSPRAAT